MVHSEMTDLLGNEASSGHNPLDLSSTSPRTTENKAVTEEIIYCSSTKYAWRKILDATGKG